MAHEINSNHRRLLEPIGNIPPAEAEERYYAMQDQIPIAAYLKPNSLRQIRGGSVGADLSAYERFLKDKLTRIDEGASIESRFALKQIRYTDTLPLPAIV